MNTHVHGRAMQAHSRRNDLCARRMFCSAGSIHTSAQGRRGVLGEALPLPRLDVDLRGPRGGPALHVRPVRVLGAHVDGACHDEKWRSDTKVGDSSTCVRAREARGFEVAWPPVSQPLMISSPSGDTAMQRTCATACAREPHAAPGGRIMAVALASGDKVASRARTWSSTQS